MDESLRLQEIKINLRLRLQGSQGSTIRPRNSTSLSRPH